MAPHCSQRGLRTHQRYVVTLASPAAEAGAQRVAGLAADQHGGVVERQPLDGGRQRLEVAAVQREHACAEGAATDNIYLVRVRFRVRMRVRVRVRVLVGVMLRGRRALDSVALLTARRTLGHSLHLQLFPPAPLSTSSQTCTPPTGPGRTRGPL